MTLAISRNQSRSSGLRSLSRQARKKLGHKHPCQTRTGWLSSGPYIIEYLSEQYRLDGERGNPYIRKLRQKMQKSFLKIGLFCWTISYREECPDCSIPHRLNHMRKFSRTYEWESAGSDEWALGSLLWSACSAISTSPSARSFFDGLGNAYTIYLTASTSG